jgi:hypothetical protein
MTVTRTISLDNITPAELADLFANGLNNEQQAEFFDVVGAIAKAWPGAGWCTQACAISAELTPLARETIATLAEHAADPPVRAFPA